MTRQLCILAFAFLLFSAVPVFGDDLQPPDYRFKPWSTVAGWDFLTDQDTRSIPPDGNVPLRIGDAEPLQETFPAGAPYPSASTFGDVRFTEALGGGYIGGSSGDNGIVFIVPNWFQNLMYTRLRLQVTYLGAQPPTTVVGYSGVPGDPRGISEINFKRVPFLDPSLPPNSSFFYEDWGILPSSNWEQVVVFIPEETILLQVVIDTVMEVLPPFFEDGYETGD